MTEAPSDSASADVNPEELGNARQMLRLLRVQAESGRINTPLLMQEVDKLHDLLTRVENHQQANRQQLRLEALFEVTRSIGTSLNLQTVLDQVMDAIIQLTGAERGFLVLRSDDGEFEITAARNFDQQTLTGDQFGYSRTVISQAIDAGRSVLTNNATQDPRFFTQQSIVAHSLRSIMATPLRVRGTVIGAIYLDSPGIVGRFQESDLTVLDMFGVQAAIAIDNARLHGATDQALAARVEELTQLRRFDLLLGDTLDLDRVLMYTLEAAGRVVNARWGTIGLIEGDPAEYHERHHFGANVELTSIQYELLQQTISSTHTQLVIENSEMVISLPIMREERVLGVVVLGCAEPPRSDRIDLVQRLIARAAMAVDNARLYTAVKAADLAKSEFVGIVAHDLKAPMSNILGYAELGLMDADGNRDERLVGYLEQVKRNVLRMVQLVSDLADISRIESGHFSMQESVVAVNTVVQSVVDSNLPQIIARGHHLVSDVPDGLAPIWVDYYRLEQVLVNFVTNAIKYTPDGGTITLSARPLTTTIGLRVRFSVSDTGIGIPPEQIANLGRKFWRATDHFTRSQPGTGLGFAIAKALVEQMGDHITIESEVGRGSTFSFSVPVASAAAIAASSQPG